MSIVCSILCLPRASGLVYKMQWRKSPSAIGGVMVLDPKSEARSGHLFISWIRAD